MFAETNKEQLPARQILLIPKIFAIVSGNVTGNKKCVPYLTPERITTSLSNNVDQLNLRLILNDHPSSLFNGSDRIDQPKSSFVYLSNICTQVC